jgi:hypothetical protein
MREARNPIDRLRDIIEGRLAPALSSVGFAWDRTTLVSDRGDVRWMVEVDQATWSTPARICFTIRWGVAVPGLDEVLGDAGVRAPGVDGCLIQGRLGETPSRLEAAWFSVNAAMPPLDRVADARTTGSLLRLVDVDVLPRLAAFDSIADVQAHLVEGLVRGRGAAGDDELRRIRAIAGLSLLLGAPENASRWLDYLEARSSVAIAPDVVAERLAALRQRGAS